MPPAKKVLTPGSYNVAKEKKKAAKKSKRGRPVVSTPVKKRKKREKAKRRDKYTEQDMVEAMRLVREEDYSIKAASSFTNEVKINSVPRMTLSDRLKKPYSHPPLGRRNELSEEVEEALVQCLEMCSEFQFPMKKRDLQDLVQAYCVEKDVNTRWKDSRPGNDWIRNFKRRWSHRVKVKKPCNIKRSRAKVGPEEVRNFFDRLAPNLEGIPPTHIFNYDESPIKDDPQAEDAFFSTGCKYYEQARLIYKSMTRHNRHRPPGAVCS
jgi:hypothetical protein